MLRPCYSLLLYPPVFFFNDTATTEIYTLSLHDALPISPGVLWREAFGVRSACRRFCPRFTYPPKKLQPRINAKDRKSTRLNSSHTVISYAVFCLKKKKQQHRH